MTTEERVTMSVIEAGRRLGLGKQAATTPRTAVTYRSSEWVGACSSRSPPSTRCSKCARNTRSLPPNSLGACDRMDIASGGDSQALQPRSGT